MPRKITTQPLTGARWWIPTTDGERARAEADPTYQPLRFSLRPLTATTQARASWAVGAEMAHPEGEERQPEAAFALAVIRAGVLRVEGYTVPGPDGQPMDIATAGQLVDWFARAPASEANLLQELFVAIYDLGRLDPPSAPAQPSSGAGGSAGTPPGAGAVDGAPEIPSARTLT